MTLKQQLRVAQVVFAIFTFAPAYAQQGRWATAGNATAKFIVDAERQWAESACNHNKKIAETILADDFLAIGTPVLQGTSSEGTHYTKSVVVAETADLSKTARDCRLIDAKVRFFGGDLAIAYGRERSVRKATDGPEKSQCVIWTDIWLKRKGSWQIITAQDTEFDCR